MVGMMAVGLPKGFLIGMVAGTVLYYASERFNIGFARQGRDEKGPRAKD